MTLIRRVARRARAEVRRRWPAGPMDESAPLPVDAGGGQLRSRYFGVTRFSVFAPENDSWRLTRGTARRDVDAYADHLYAPERMAPRCEIFCELSAPLFQQMADRHDYRHLVRYSTRMPERWTDVLRSAAERYPVLQLVEVADQSADALRVVREGLGREASRDDALVFFFRIDDDDLLAMDYLDQVEQFMSPAHEGYAVSFASGYAALYEDGSYTSLRRYRNMLPSMGQGAIGRWLGDRQELRLEPIKRHTATHLRRPVLLDGRLPTFLQTRHLGQDTAIKEGQDFDPATARSVVLDKLGSLPEVPLADVLERFPTLRGRIAPEVAGDGPS